MANLIQVKRSTTNATPASLAAGELAYSFLNTSNSLFVGNTSTGGPIRIGGGKYVFLHQANTSTPGALTANAVVIVNGNSFVSDWKTNSLTVGTDAASISIANISSFANSTQLGVASASGSNAELATTYAIKQYVDLKSAAASIVATNNQILYGNNNTYAQSSKFTFDYSTATLAVGNSSVNTTIDGASVSTTTVYAPVVSTTAGFIISSNGTTNTVFTAAGQLRLPSDGTVMGGTYDGSQLTLGATQTDLKQLRDGNVTIQVGTGGTATKTWTFSNTGNLSAPGNFTTGGTVNTAILNVSGAAGLGDTNITGSLDVTTYGTFGGAVNAASLNVSGAVGAGNTTVSGRLSTGNTTVTGFVNVSSYGTFGGAVNAASLNVSGAVGAGNTTVTGFVTATGTVNAAALNIGANINVTTSSISVGNSSVNTQISAGDIKLNGSQITIGNTATNTTITGTSATFGGPLVVNNTAALGNTTVTGFVNASSYGTFGGTVNAAALNISGVTASGNTTVTGFVNVSSYGTFGGAVNAASLNVGGAAATGNLSVTGTVGSGNTTVTGFINVSTSGTFGGTVNAAAMNVSGLAAAGNTTITGFVNASSFGTFGGVVNATSFNSTGSATSTFANNLTINGTTNTVNLNVSGDASISGNLYVTGNLVSINVSTIAITDSLIQLASNNNMTPDVLDIGLYGNYGIDANTSNHRHTGLFRDASDSVWKLFDNLLSAPDTTVDTANATFRFTTLQSQLSAGGAGASGFIANATTIAVTANSTLNVAIVANTLTLSSALGGTSGGTGLASYTSEDLLVANSSNGFRKLSVGSEGYVLQVSSGTVSWNTLDGGSF